MFRVILFKVCAVNIAAKRWLVDIAIAQLNNSIPFIIYPIGLSYAQKSKFRKFSKT